MKSNQIFLKALMQMNIVIIFIFGKVRLSFNIQNIVQILLSVLVLLYGIFKC